MFNKGLFDLYAAANVVGQSAVIEKIDFSFIISTRYVSDDQEDLLGLRVLMIWDSAQYRGNPDGVMFLSSDYSYVPVPGSYLPSEEELAAARKFFKKYIVLFAAAWEEEIDTSEIPSYFKGYSSFEELKNAFYVGKDLIASAKSIQDIENIMRKYNVFEFPN